MRVATLSGHASDSCSERPRPRSSASANSTASHTSQAHRKCASFLHLFRSLPILPWVRPFWGLLAVEKVVVCEHAVGSRGLQNPKGQIPPPAHGRVLLCSQSERVQVTLVSSIQQDAILRGCAVHLLTSRSLHTPDIQESTLPQDLVERKEFFRQPFRMSVGICIRVLVSADRPCVKRVYPRGGFCQ